MKIKTAACAAAIAGVLGLASMTTQASPIPSLTFSVNDGSSPSVGYTVVGAPGAVSWSGVMDGWTIYVDTGTSAAPDAGANPGLDLTVNARYNGTGPSNTITFSLLGTGFTTPIGQVTMFTDIGGTLGVGTSAIQSSSLNGNPIYTSSTLVGGSGTQYGPGSTTFFGDTNAANINPNGTYSLGTSVTLTATRAGQSSFDAAVGVPEPGTLGLVGLALLGMGYLRRPRTVAAKAEV